MARPIPVSLARWSLVLVAAILLPACSDDSTGPDTIDLSELATQMSRINSGIIVADKTSASALDLWKVITPVMAGESGVTPPGSSPSPARTEAQIAELPPIIQALIRPRSGPEFAGLTAQPPLPPLGIACDWNPDGDGWKGAGERIGIPSTDAIRFELYDVLSGKPALPLNPIGTVIDIAPGSQGSTGASVLDVKLNAGTPGDGGNGVLGLILSGQWRTSELNLLMGGFVSAAGGRMDYQFQIDQAFAINEMTVEDLGINSRLTADFSLVATGNVTINKSGSGDVGTVEFDYEFDRNTFGITTGTVEINGQQVATMAGLVATPTFTITSDALEAADRAFLTSIFLDQAAMDERITQLWAWGYCLGADTVDACTLSAALLPG